MPLKYALQFAKPNGMTTEKPGSIYQISQVSGVNVNGLKHY